MISSTNNFRFIHSLFVACCLLFPEIGFATFKDQDHIPPRAQTAIQFLAEIEILKGDPKGNFNPHQSINRAELTKLLVLATNTPVLKTKKSQFSDVDPTDWFFPYVETAAQKGWISGHPNGSFLPHNHVNRAEIAKIYVQAFNIPIPKVNNPAHWFSPYFKALEDQDKYKVDLLPYLFPDSHPNRTEVAEQIYHFLKNNKQQTTNIKTNHNQIDLSTPSSIINTITNNSSLNFSPPFPTSFEWLDQEDGKIKYKEIQGLSTHVKNIPFNQAAIPYFNHVKKKFRLTRFNSEGVRGNGKKGFQKDNIVCLVHEKSPTVGTRDVRVECGEIPNGEDKVIDESKS